MRIPVVYKESLPEILDLPLAVRVYTKSYHVLASAKVELARLRLRWERIA